MAESLVINEIYLSLQGESSWVGWPCVFVRLTGCNLRCSYCDTAYAFGQGQRWTLEAVLDRVAALSAPFTGWQRKLPCSVNTLLDHEPEDRDREPHRPGNLEPLNPLPVHAKRPEPTNLLCDQARPDQGRGGTRPYQPVQGKPRLPLVEVTGGEPLLQAGVMPLMTRLCDAGHTVLLETSGALDIQTVDPRVHRIMDWKCPSSGESARNLPENLAALRSTDELKFVVGTEADYAWMKGVLERHGLAERCPVLVSWVAPLLPDQRHPTLKAVPAGDRALSRRELAERVVADALPVRFQVQLHKVVWAPDARGV